VGRSLTVAAAQLGPYAGGKEDMLARLVALMDQAGSAGVDLLVYPELALCPYFGTLVIDDQAQWFEPEMPSRLTQPLFDRACDLGIAFVLPYAETDEGRCYNSSVVVRSDGTIAGKYRKTHISGSAPAGTDSAGSLERRYFREGDLGLPVFELAGARTGVLICYDRRYPEAYRSYQLAGAEVLLVGYATGSKTKPLDFVTMQSELTLRANAYLHGQYVVAAGKAGIEYGTPYIGGSCVIAPTGQIMSKARTVADELVVATIDLDDGAAEYTSSRFNENRRPDLYGLLTE
jgi:predicted amidohydrolase